MSVIALLYEAVRRIEQSQADAIWIPHSPAYSYAYSIFSF